MSTLGTTAIEDVRAANPHGRNWFQLYMWKDRERSMALVERAAAAGFDTLLVTVRTVLDAIPRPGWWFNLLTTEPLRSRRWTAGQAPSRSTSTLCSIRRSRSRI
ncbi:hypothetical protein HNP02_000883 [Mycobacterium sp. AZCC_0083]|nr:hypothetical protein [Mycobacterium sp. AZCC_0083]